MVLTSSGIRVATRPGCYVVTVPSSNGVQVRVVARDRTCSCGRSNCMHIGAVIHYLKSGGERATDSTQENIGSSDRSVVVTRCPVCESDTVYGKYRWSASDIWHCSSDTSHYWLYRSEPSVRLFMTGGRETGIPAIDEMTILEHEEFIRRMTGEKQAEGTEPRQNDTE